MDGRQTTHDHNMSLESSASVPEKLRPFCINQKVTLGADLGAFFLSKRDSSFTILYSQSHVVQMMVLGEFLHKRCEEKSETFTEF